MSEHSHRSKRNSWRARERRLRAEYRGKIAISIIVSLLVGMIGGIIVDKVVFTKKDVSVQAPAATVTAENTDNAVPNLFGNTTTSEQPAATITEAPTTEEASPSLELSDEEPDLNDEFIPAELPEDAFPEEDNEEDEPAPAPTLAIGGSVEAAPSDDNDDEAFVAALSNINEQSETPVEEATEEPTEAPTEEPTAVPTDEPTEAPTEEPTAEPTPEPTPAPEVPTIVPYGSTYTLTTDINPDGSAHMEDDGTEFENVELSVRVKKYLDFDYYDRTYGMKYNLKGGTAAVVLEITLNNYTGSAPIVPQNFLLVTFCNEDGTVTTQGVQIIDAEISGNVGVAITSDVPATVYKRYYKEDAGEMTYMVVTTYNNGIKESYWFEIIIPPEMITPEPTADPDLTTLKVGSRGDDVVKLQQTLIDSGYLDEKADGIYGSNTAEAVKKMQKQFSMEETGVADSLFLTYLYMETDY